MILILLIGIAIGYFVHLTWFTLKPLVETEYKTDTIFKSVPFVPINYVHMDSVKPHYVIRYAESPINGKLIRQNDSLIIVIDSLSAENLEDIYIPDNYLLQYPFNPKLIELALSRDSLQVTLLDIDATMASLKYPLYLTKYKYWLTYDKGQPKFVRADIPGFDKVEPITDKPKFKVQPYAYVYTGYTSYESSLFLSGELGVMKKRWKLSGEMMGAVTPTIKGLFFVRMGYRLDSWQNNK